ncbi:MAG: SDR family oxidoreductase [Chloroflexi bacterium]|nr:SDR family oxidoreductase [Chloroflexota bacterium]
MAEWLKGKVAAITGGGGGLGRAIALAMSEQGASIVVNDLGGSVDGSGSSQTAAQKVVDEIKAKGGHAVPNYESVTSVQGAEAIVKTALENFGKLDIMVTCAGILRDRMLFNMSEQEFDSVIAVHVKGTFACVKAASMVMRQQRSGRIITFTSSTGLFGNIGQTNYAAAKSAITGITKCAAYDLGRYGVTVNAMAPLAATRMTMTEDVKKSLALQAEKGIRSGFETSIDRMMPEDVAPAVCYLASDLAANVNGQVIYSAGNEIAVVSPPRAVKTIWKPGRWTAEELVEVVPQTLAQGIVNPAPAQEAK